MCASNYILPTSRRLRGQAARLPQNVPFMGLRKACADGVQAGSDQRSEAP
jgi:hypothetical protein